MEPTSNIIKVAIFLFPPSSHTYYLFFSSKLFHGLHILQNFKCLINNYLEFFRCMLDVFEIQIKSWCIFIALHLQCTR